jgi:hypothetical protein
MLKKELRSRDRSEIAAGMRFWGIEEDAHLDDLIAHITTRTEIALHLVVLKTQEVRILAALLSGHGMCPRGSLSTEVGEEDTLAESLKSLEGKFFIYIRKDRRLLTDRYDKVYLFPEVRRVLEEFPRYDRAGLKRHLRNLFQQYATSTDRNVRAIMEMGGFIPVHKSSLKEALPLSEEGRIEAALLLEKNTLVPLWIVTAKSIESVRQTQPKSLHFKPSIYLSTLTKIIDCLSFRPFTKRNSHRAVMSCVKKHALDADSTALYYGDLHSLGVIQEKNGRMEVNSEFARKPYDEKKTIVENLLSQDERDLLALVKKKKCSSISWLLFSMILETSMDWLYTDPGAEVMEEPSRRYRAAIETLVGRGIVQKDSTDLYVRVNSLEVPTFPKDALVLNTDRELLVFSEIVTNYALYILVSYSNIQHYGQIIRLSVDRDSIARGIEYAGEIGIFLDCLRSCAKRGSVGQTLVDQITGWAKAVQRIAVRGCWMIEIDSPEARLRLYQNRYVQSMVVGETDSFILLRRNADINRVRQEMRAMNVFIHVEEEER